MFSDEGLIPGNLMKSSKVSSEISAASAGAAFIPNYDKNDILEALAPSRREFLKSLHAFPIRTNLANSSTMAAKDPEQDKPEMDRFPALNLASGLASTSSTLTPALSHYPRPFSPYYLNLVGGLNGLGGLNHLKNSGDHDLFSQWKYHFPDISDIVFYNLKHKK